jgi:hypothetical protein
MPEAMEVHLLIDLHANGAEVVIEERGRLTGKEAARVRLDLGKQLLLTPGNDRGKLRCQCTKPADECAPRLRSIPAQKQSAPAKASGTMDCFRLRSMSYGGQVAEPVIGRAFARVVGAQ